ncbi:MAG: hypothetical protein ABIK09_10155 [Pseudomonadota bacterium]
MTTHPLRILVIALLLAFVAACASDGGGQGGPEDDSIVFTPDNDTTPGDSSGTPGIDTPGVPDADTTGGGGDADEPPVEAPHYESAELAVRILGPSASGGAEVLGGAISVTGVVMGLPDSITWTSDKGSAGEAEDSPFWKTGKVDLVQGDNMITVTATKGDEVVQDRIRITYNPGFLFDADLKIIPGGFFMGQTVTLRFAMPMGSYTNYDPSSLVLCQCTSQGQCIQDLHQLMDDGLVGTSGDGVGEDGIYSWKESYTPNIPGPLCFRARTLVTAGEQSYTAYTPVQCVDVVEHFTVAQCQATRTTQQTAKAVFDDAFAQAGLPAALQTTLDSLKTDPQVVDAGLSPGGHAIWVLFQSGVLGALAFPPEGVRGGGGDSGYRSIEAPVGADILIESKRSTILSPYHAELGDLDEAAFMYNVLDFSQCPPYVIDGPYFDGQAKLNVWRSLANYGVIGIATHGEALFGDLALATKASFGWRHPGNQEVLWSGEDVNCDLLYQDNDSCSGPGTCPGGSECVITESQGSNVSGVCVDWKQIDLRRGNLVMGLERYGVLPSHVATWRDDGYPASFVYLGACRSLWNGTLAMEFFAAGARAVAGYTGAVTNDFAYQQGSKLVSALVEEEKLTEDAMPYGEDPASPGTTLGLFGATNLNIYDSNILNPSWETGDLTGWLEEGHGQVASRLGGTEPVEGKFMALMSTGMGYTLQTGGIEQIFCIPDTVGQVSFYWKLYSEEFKEWCGSEYMDTFQATLESDAGNITLVDTWIDALCPPGECFNCGSQFVGLAASDVEFDQGDVWNIEWQKVEANATALAGAGPVTMRFFTGDVGDSIYDTVVLVDTVKFD